MKTKRISAFLTALMMCLTLLPAAARAEGDAAEVWSPDMQTRIGTYASLAEALAAANQAGMYAGVKLLQDVTVGSGTTLTLNDSINMKQWFDEAVEKATETPFPWLAVIVVVVIVILLVAGFIIFLPVLRTILENRNRAKHYKRNKKSGGMSRSMGSVPMKKYKPHKRHKRRR